MQKYLFFILFSSTALLANPTSRITPYEILEEQERAWQEREAKAPQSPHLAKGFFNSAPIHVGSYHHYDKITPTGDVLELEDGSQWSVKPSDRFKTHNWYTTDILTLTANHSWFSGEYLFRITNISQNESLEVKLSRKPDYNGLSTYWIVAIDYVSQQLHLNDGSIWNLSSFHYMTFKDWMVNDTIILGHNEGFCAKTWSNILVNCDTNSYVEARCIK